MTDKRGALVDKLAADLKRLVEARSSAAVEEIEKEIKRAIASAGIELDSTLAATAPKKPRKE